MLRCLLAATACGAILTTPVLAADIDMGTAPESEIYEWSGFYIGATAGYAWGDADFEIDPTGAWASSPAGAASIEAETETTLDPNGFIGGVKAGVNQQFGTWVWGIETDISYVNADDENDGGAIPLTSIDSFSQEAELNWLATLRLRAGLSFDRALIYATGGLALGDWDVEMRMTSSGVDAVFSESDWEAGWVVGGGLAYALSDAWSVNVEYLYVDFGEVEGDSVFPPPNVPNFTHDHEVDLTTQIVRVGISYEF